MKKPTESQPTVEFVPQANLEQPTANITSGGQEAGDQPVAARVAIFNAGDSTRARYEMDRLYAEGGIGQVWLAHDTQFGRRVAIKTLRPELLDRGRTRDRFLLEARITGQLEHPGIVPVHELISAPPSGSPFYSMRFVHGRTLVEAARDFHRRRREGEREPLAMVALLSAFTAVCNTIAYAHSKGVIHRDLKGENVMLGDFGEVFILDWGVAKVLQAAEAGKAETPRAEPPDNDATRTAHGAIMGTPAYMAPEQAAGQSEGIDYRADIYGLGAILYEILTGQPPFTGSNTVEVIEKVLRENPVPPRDLWPDVPRPLEELCLRAMSKDPAQRPSSAAALGQAVQTWQETQRLQAVEDLRRSRERFELAVRGSQDGLWAWDLTTDEVFFSPRWKSMLGYEDHELANDLNEWTSRLHPDERERVLAANYAHINGTTSHYEYEYRLRHKDGSYRWILARGVALRDAAGKAYRMAGSHVDITDRKKTEQALRECEQSYRVVIRSAPCGILVIDADGRVRDGNAPAARLLGVGLDDLIGTPLAAICKSARRADGSPLEPREICGLSDAEAAEPHGEIAIALCNSAGGSSKVFLSAAPLVCPETAKQFGMLLFLRQDARLSPQ